MADTEKWFIIDTSRGYLAFKTRLELKTWVLQHPNIAVNSSVYQAEGPILPVGTIELDIKVV